MKYARRGYLFHIHTNGESLKGFLVNTIAYGVTLLFLRRPVLTFHAGADQTYFPRRKSWIAVPTLKFLFGAANAVICDDAEVARHVAAYGILPRKVYPINPFTRQYLDCSSITLDVDAERFCDRHSPIVLTYVECRPEYAAGVGLSGRR